jgi:hypothetical protein
MRELLRVVGAFAILLFFFFATLYLMNYFAPLCPRGESVDLNPPFQKAGNGFAYIASAPSLEDRSDSSATPVRSKFLVCENEYALGPSHTIHADVATKGKGRFSHWTAAGFIFSASDNSNPNANGKHYRAALETK